MNVAVQTQEPQQIVPWVLYTCVAVIVCAVFTFPYDALRARVLAEISTQSGLHISAAEWQLVWPLGFTGHRVTISQPGRWEVLADQVATSVSVLSLLTGKPRLDVTAMFPGRASAGAGIVEAKMIMSAWAESGPIALTGRLERVDLGTLKLKGVTQGLLQGTVDQQWQRSSDGRLMPVGEANWDARIENLVLDQLPVGPFMLPTLTIAKTMLTVHCQSAVCQVLTFKGDGPDGSVSGSGTVTVGPSVLQTNVALSLTLAPGAGYAQRLAAAGIPMAAGPITVHLTGPLAQPVVSL